MEFWGVEVKSGTPLKVQPGDGMVIHLSQASLGEVKANKTESVRLYVTVDGNKLVLGTLMSDKLPQLLFDLVFDKDFEISHNSKSGSIYLFGYKADNGSEDGDEFESDDSEEEEEEEDIPIVSNGKPKAMSKPEVPVAVKNAKKSKDSAAGKQKVQIVEPPKAMKPEDEEDDSEDDLDFEGSGDSDEDKTSVGDLMDEDDESDSEDEESDEEDDTPQKVAPSKKRGAESAIKTPVSEKKAKLATPQKTDGKKSAHVSTPYPSKKGGKTPANTPTNKSNQKSPKSGGPHSCGSCKKGFVSEFAMQAHAKAKHSAEK